LQIQFYKLIMATQSEQELENQLIKQLTTEGYERVTIPNEDALKQNLRTQLNLHNNKELKGVDLTDDEFRQILIHLEGGTVFQKSKKLRDRFLLKRSEYDAYIEFFDSKDWCKNRFCRKLMK